MIGGFTTALRRAPGLPPGPRGYPFMGVILSAYRDPLGFLFATSRQYGDVVAMRFGIRRVCLVTHPDHVKQVLHDKHGIYGKSPAASRVKSLFGHSLTSVDGDRWRRQRTLMQPAFQARRQVGFVPLVVQTTANMLARWPQVSERSGALELFSEMTALTRAIILKVVFGEVEAGEAQALGQALDVAVFHVDRRLWHPLGGLDMPTPASRRFRHALRTIDASLVRLIARARRAAPVPQGLLGTLLNGAGGDSPARDLAVRYEIKALLVAGHTTTASALAWVWCVLSAHPSAWQRLRQEVVAVLGDGLPTADDLAKLPYTRMLIAEVLRLYPPTWVTGRTLRQEDQIGGYRIPAGTIVLLSPFVTHRHPGFWSDPDRFDPERFAPAAVAARPLSAYFPFGQGPRACIGSGFALLVLHLAVAMIAQRYRLALVPGSRVALHPGLTLHPKPGLLVIPARADSG